MIKTFKGKLNNGDIQRIRLSTNTGEIGYRIVKMDCIGSDPRGSGTEGVFQVYSVKPATSTGTINFDNPLLLAVAFYENNSSQSYFGGNQIVFDHTIVNQDIFITLASDDDINYYIEMEQVKLNLNEATVATLKDMRGNYTNQTP